MRTMFGEYFWVLCVVWVVVTILTIVRLERGRLDNEKFSQGVRQQIAVFRDWLRRWIGR